MSRPFMHQNRQLSILQMIGACLLLLGVIFLIGTVFHDLIDKAAAWESNLVATGVFLIMMGIAFLFPDMLKGSDRETTSAMRVAVFMVVSVFSILAVKIFWGCKPADFVLNPNWAWLVGTALGSKAIQSLGENNVFRRNTSQPGSTLPANTFFAGDQVDKNLPLHNTSDIGPAPENPPVFLKPKK